MLRYRQRAGRVAEGGEDGLQVQRRRVVRRAADAREAQRRLDALPLRAADDVHVVHVAGLVAWQLAGLTQAEARVAEGGGTARGVRVVEPLEEEPQRRGLELVEARVVAHELERLLVLRAVEAQQADPLGELGVGRRDEAAVTDAREVLRREEAERACKPIGSRAPVAERGTERLGGVLDDGNSVGQAVDRHGPAEEVDGNDGLRARSDPSCHVFGVEVQGLGVDIREDRRGTHPCDRLRGREEREGGADHLVAGADLERVEHQDERVGAVRDADRVRRAEVQRRPPARTPRPPGPARSVLTRPRRRAVAGARR